MAKNHKDERDLIAEAAERTIAKLGLGKCSLKDIAKEAGVTTGKLMYYFRDKDELLFYVKNRLFDQVWERARKIANSYQGVQKLIEMVMVEIPLDREGILRQKVLAELKVLALSSRKIRRKQILRDEKGWLQIQEVIEQLQREGDVSRKVDANVAAFGIISLIEGISSHFIIAPKVQSEPTIRKLVTQYVNAMVRDDRG